MWAVGLIQAELEIRTPFLPGMSLIDQLTKIFDAMGTCTDEEWPVGTHCHVGGRLSVTIFSCVSIFFATWG